MKKPLTFSTLFAGALLVMLIYTLLEAVSEPSQYDHDTGDLGEAVKEKRIVFVACHQTTEGLQPADGTLDDPAFAIAPERSAVLSGRTNAALAMRADEFNAALGQA